MEILSENRSFNGVQHVYRHASKYTKGDMRFAAYIPDHEPHEKLPVIWYLSGLTCTHANVMEKGEYRQACSEHKIIFIAVDTSPRGDNVADDPHAAYDFGLGAGFYVDATQSPFSDHYQMRSYIENELPNLMESELPIDCNRQGIMGHSMGGHGALTIGLRNSDRYRSISAFAPIVSPINCPWGQKALSGYLGEDETTWQEYDACALIENGARHPNILIDQGLADDFLIEQLKPHMFQEICDKMDQPVTIRIQPEHDHSYYFISTFMAEHIEWHAERLRT